MTKTLFCAAALAALALPVAAQTAATKPDNSQGPAYDELYYGSTWKRLDANGDGRVSRAEYLAYHGSRWDNYDARKQGYMDRNEARRLILEREMSKTDGTPMGDPQNPTTKR